jgi:hypothetical protein
MLRIPLTFWLILGTIWLAFWLHRGAELAGPEELACTLDVPVCQNPALPLLASSGERKG